MKIRQFARDLAAAMFCLFALPVIWLGIIGYVVVTGTVFRISKQPPLKP